MAAFADVPTYHTLPDSENSFFECVGITQVADRLAVVVEIGYGLDYDVTSRQADTEPGQPHPQFALLIAATEALSR